MDSSDLQQALELHLRLPCVPEYRSYLVSI